MQPKQENSEIENRQKLLQNIEKQLVARQQSLIQEVKQLNSELTNHEVEEQLSEETKKQINTKMDEIVKSLLVLQKKIQVIDEIREDGEQFKNQQQENTLRESIQITVKEYEPTQESIATRKEQLLVDPNQSNWTDATQSQADDNQIWVVDDNIIQAMQQESDASQKSGSDSEEDIEQQQCKQEINYDQLQQQFVTGGESDHLGLYGKHDKFCVSVKGIQKQGLLFSGGGDDYLYFYKLKTEDLNPEQCIKPYHLIKHSQTINKIQVSYSKDFIFSMTDNEILCTQLKTLQTLPLKKRQTKQEQKQSQCPPICSDFACHHLGDVVALSNQFQLQIFNIKGLKSYQTYYCEKQINMLKFTQSGKQICLACEDNRLRLLTVKSGQFTRIGGVNQHKNQISALATKGNIILSGCIDGYIGISNIKNNSMTALIGTKQTQQVYGSINHLQFAGNYFVAGSAQQCIDWYDLTKTKKLFHSEIDGSSTDIVWQGTENQHLYNVSTIKGHIYLYDCRNPLKELQKVRAGNTIHKMWADKNMLAAACEDGHVRYYDVRKIIPS